MPTPEEYQKRHEELLAKMDDFIAAVKDKAGYEGAGIGFRVVGGKPTEEIGFFVVVKEKKPLSEMAEEDVMPRTHADEPVDVVPVPDFEPLSGTRPLVGGVKCTPLKGGYGTLGGMGRRNSNQKAVLVSNNHVLYGENKGDGDPIYQPGPSCCNSYVVGKNVDTNIVLDAAIAETSVGATNNIKQIGTVTGTSAAVTGLLVRKYGARTGYTEGTVQSVMTTSPFTVTVLPTANYSLFADKGDSGSFIVDQNNQVVVSLLHSRNPTDHTMIYSSDIGQVMTALGISIPNPDLVSAMVLDAAAGPDGPPDLGEYEKKLNQSVNGRAGLQTIKAYAEEVANLAHHNRAVTVVWIDNKGPQFGEAWEEAEQNPSMKLPKTVDGVPVATLLNNMTDILTQKGSPSLAAALKTYRNAVIAAVDQLDSVADLENFVNGKTIHCFAVTFLWTLIWNDGSEFYLPTVAKKGLKIPALGINIAPFSTITVGDIPEVTMFDEPVLGYMKLTLTDTRISGIDTVQPGQYSCTDNKDGTTTMDIGLSFSKVEFTGNYEVSAGGGVAGCAIAGAASILGGGDLADAHPGMLMADGPVQDNVNLSMWYREPLGQSANGRALIGAYYCHQDTILDLQNEGGGKNPFTSSMTASTVKSTTSSVTTATKYYQDQQNGLLSKELAAADPPTIGSEQQYESGSLPYAYLIAMARQKVRNGQDPDGRFASLANDATNFIHTTSWYQTTYPGEQPIGGEDGVLDRIAKADPQKVQAYVMEQDATPVKDPETGEIVEYIEPSPINLETYHRTYNRMLRTATDAAVGSPVTGTFADTGVDISIQLTLTLSGNMGDNPQADVQKMLASIGGISIKLESTSGWWPGMFDKVSNWIANNEFFLDMLKDQAQKAVSGPTVRDALSGLITGAMKKLG